MDEKRITLEATPTDFCIQCSLDFRHWGERSSNNRDRKVLDANEDIWNQIMKRICGDGWGHGDHPDLEYSPTCVSLVRLLTYQRLTGKETVTIDHACAYLKRLDAQIEARWARQSARTNRLPSDDEIRTREQKELDKFAKWLHAN